MRPLTGVGTVDFAGPVTRPDRPSCWLRRGYDAGQHFGGVAGNHDIDDSRPHERVVRQLFLRKQKSAQSASSTRMG